MNFCTLSKSLLNLVENSCMNKLLIGLWTYLYLVIVDCMCIFKLNICDWILGKLVIGEQIDIGFINEVMNTEFDLVS